MSNIIRKIKDDILSKKLILVPRGNTVELNNKKVKKEMFYTIFMRIL